MGAKSLSPMVSGRVREAVVGHCKDLDEFMILQGLRDLATPQPGILMIGHILKLQRCSLAVRLN